MLGQLTEVMSMDDVQVLYPKERITLYGINSNCELFLPIARSSFPSYFPFCFCSLLLQRRAVAALLSPGEVHGVVLCIALVFLSFLRFLLYSVDWTSVGHSLRCGSLGLETSTLNSFGNLFIDKIHTRLFRGFHAIPNSTKTFTISQIGRK